MKKLLTLAVLTVGTSFGSVIAMTTTGSSGVDSDAYTVGWAFSISTTISVSALGYYDAGANGLSSSHTVGIYTSTGTLLMSTTVPSGTTGTLTSNYRMTSVTPLILGPGNYVVAGFSNSANDALPFGATLTPATGITLGAKDLYVYGAALTFPTLNANNGTTYGAANFVFTESPSRAPCSSRSAPSPPWASRSLFRKSHKSHSLIFGKQPVSFLDAGDRVLFVSSRGTPRAPADKTRRSDSRSPPPKNIARPEPWPRRPSWQLAPGPP